MVRQTVLLRRIIGHFATPTQLREYDTLVLKNKGSASHFAFRLIERYFEHRDRKENPERYTQDTQTREQIKVNSSNGSFLL